MILCLKNKNIGSFLGRTLVRGLVAPLLYLCAVVLSVNVAFATTVKDRQLPADGKTARGEKLLAGKISEIVTTKDGYKMLSVYGRPFVIKGVVYQPIPPGKNWEFDFFAQGKALADVDGPLLKEMGVNVVRIYCPGSDKKATKAFIHYLYENYGIYTIMGHWLGFWNSPNYADEAFKEYVKHGVINMVRDFEDEPGIIMWILGNENNFSFGPENLNVWTTPELIKERDPMKRREKKARIYYRFVNELAREIKKADSSRVVALGNGGTRFMDIAGQECPDVDLAGLTLFLGKSFGHVWRDMHNMWKKPFFVMEFGADSLDAVKKKEDEDVQSLYIGSLWKEISRNLPGNNGWGNVLGGIVFEWSDEWWKSDHYDPKTWNRHDMKGDWSCGGYYHDIAAPKNLNMNEEWWGIVKVSRRKNSNGINKRVPKKAYYILKGLWKGSSPKELKSIADARSSAAQDTNNHSG